MDVYGQALKDYANGIEDQKLWLNTSYGELEEMPVWYFFRTYEEMPPLEKMALNICEGRVLDVGAGTGSHAICLQKMQLPVVGIDTSTAAVDIMKASQVKDARVVNYFDFKEEKFDTLLCLMNGLGFIGKLNNLEVFLNKARELLKPEGQILVDSSDISYLFETSEKPKDHYFGEVSFQYEYKGQKGKWFDWVYVDQNTLKKKCIELNWHCQVLTEDEQGQYLARLTY